MFGMWNVRDVECEMLDVCRNVGFDLQNAAENKD